jgi:hypothetical protein
MLVLQIETPSELVDRYQRSGDTMVPIYKYTWHYNPEYQHWYLYYHDSLSSHTVI